jgi:hypothetical protein
VQNSLCLVFVCCPIRASPPTSKGRIAWGLSIAVLDGIMRFFEIRYSPFSPLYRLRDIAILRWLAALGLREKKSGSTDEFR